VSGLRAAAGRWRGFAAALNGVRDALDGPRSVIAGQEMPEGALIQPILSTIGSDLASIGAECGKLATALVSFADEVSHAQNAIRDLLNRFGSASGLWHEVVLILEGDALDEIKKIAADITAVLRNMAREAHAQEQVMKLGMHVLDGLVLDMEKFMRGQFTRFLGDEIGNPVATVFDTWVNANEGVLKGAVGMVEGVAALDPRRFLIDPEGAGNTWKGMLKTGSIYQFINPQEAAEADKQMLKGLLHLEDWRRDRPGLGFGENLFDVASLFVPGFGEAGAGVKGATAGARAAEAGADATEAAAAAGRGGRVAGELGGVSATLGDIGKESRGLTTELENLGRDLPKTEPPVGGRPVSLPPRPVEAPVEPTPRPGESGPPGRGPTTEPPPDSPSSAAPRPGGPVGPHDTAPVGAAAAHPGPGPAEHLLSTHPEPAEPVPAKAPVSPAGSLVEPAPAAAQSSQPAPALTSAAPHASTPQFTPSAGHPAELPTPVGSPRGLSDGGPSHGHPHERSPHGPGDGGPAGSHPPGPPSDGGGPPGTGLGGLPEGRPCGLPPDDGGPSGLSHGDPAGERQDPVHSHESSGDGWHRLPDAPTDPHYGEPLPRHWDFTDDPVEPSGIDGGVAKIIHDPEAPFGRDPRGHAYTEQEYAERFNKVGDAGERWGNFPLNDGAVPGTRVAYTDPERFIRDYGSQLDRVGQTSGKYLAIMENGQAGSWEQRALHINSLRDPYHAYAFGELPDGWSIEVSEVAPGLGQPGGSIQVRIFDAEGETRRVTELTRKGVLR
jgi:hypothetical protein